jgi:hypothetical protein
MTVLVFPGVEPRLPDELDSVTIPTLGIANRTQHTANVEQLDLDPPSPAYVVVRVLSALVSHVSALLEWS